MKIRTLWENNTDDDGLMPWLVAACDEYTEDAHNGIPDWYQKEMKDNRRELIIEIPDNVVINLFAVTVVKGKVKND